MDMETYDISLCAVGAHIFATMKVSSRLVSIFLSVSWGAASSASFSSTSSGRKRTAQLDLEDIDAFYNQDGELRELKIFRGSDSFLVNSDLYYFATTACQRTLQPRQSHHHPS